MVHLLSIFQKLEAFLNHSGRSKEDQPPTITEGFRTTPFMCCFLDRCIEMKCDVIATKRKSEKPFLLWYLVSWLETKLDLANKK